MLITFAGVVIAQDPTSGGFDAIQDFVPGDGEEIIQPRRLLRGKNTQQTPRGNRTRAFTGKVILSSQADLKTAMILRGTFYDGLPSEGAIVLTIGSTTLTCADAALKSCTILKTEKGVSVGFQLTFLPSVPFIPSTTAAPALINESGVGLENESGSPLFNP